MAGISEEITAAVSSLCNILDAKYINYCDESTHHDLECPPGNLRYIFATGSFACGEWQYGDDVRLVCMTDNTEGIFWPYVREKFQLKDNVSLPSFHEPMELSSPSFSRSNDGRYGALSGFLSLRGKNKVRERRILSEADVKLVLTSHVLGRLPVLSPLLRKATSLRSAGQDYRHDRRNISIPRPRQERLRPSHRAESRYGGRYAPACR